MRSFKSTVDYPSPSLLPFGKDEDDIAAVIAGSMPSAIILNNKKNKVLVELLEIAKQNCFMVEIEDRIYLSKDETTLKKLVTTTLSLALSLDEKIDRNISVGKLLGYCEEAIHDFVEYGIKRNMSHKEREHRRKLVSI